MESLRAKPESTTQPSAQALASQSATAEPREYPALDLDELESGFASEFGDEAGKAFRKPFEALIGQTARYSNEIEQMKGLLREQIVSGAKRELVGEYPQLADPKVFARVKDTADLLLSTGRFARYDDAMRKAAAVELAEELALAKASARFKESGERDNGQMSVPERVTPGPREPLAPEAAEDFVIAMLERGYTPEQARVELARRQGNFN